MAFSIGNTASNITWAGTTSATATITLAADSVVLVGIHQSHATVTETVSTVTSAHLTFAKRSSVSHTNSAGNDTHHQEYELWWAYSSGALTSEVITVASVGTPTDASISVIECKGLLNPSSPWDTNVSLPATNAAGSTSTAANVTLSTDSGAPVAFFFNSGTEALGATFTGWTSALSVGNIGSQFSLQRTWFQVFSSTQSSATYTINNATTDWMVVGDAFGVPALSFVVPAGSLALSSAAPLVQAAITITVPARSLALSSDAPSLIRSTVLSPASASLALTGNVPKFLQDFNANQTIPSFGFVATLINNSLSLTATQTVPNFAQVATMLGTLPISATQTIPPFDQIATLVAEAISIIARLPENIMKGARGGPAFSTLRPTGISGIQQRIVNFEQSVNQYTLGYGLNKTTWPLVLALHYAQVGGAFGFGAKDWGDYQITNQAIGTGDATTTNFQLIKVYATATRSYTRIITLPLASTLVVKVSGVVSASYSLLPEGIISFISAPSGGAAITATCDFDIKVAFDSTTDHLEIQQQLIDAGQIPVINLKEIPPTAAGLAIMHVISVPSGNIDPTHLPENVEKAARGGPTFATTRMISTSGKPFLRANYPQSVNQYTVGYTASMATWPTILAMFYTQMGGAFGFTFRDLQDYAVTNQQIGTGDGLTTDFQLVRIYDNGPRRYGRYITLPRAGTLIVTIDGTPTLAFTLQPKGIIRFTSAPANNAVIVASFQFDLPVCFKDDHLDVTIQPGNSAPATVAQIASLGLQEILPGSP